MKAVVTIDREECKGCSLCVYICPKNVLKMDETYINKRATNPAKVKDIDACIACASCARLCPDGVITIEKETGG